MGTKCEMWLVLPYLFKRKKQRHQFRRYFENVLQRFTSKRGNSEKLFFLKYIYNGSVLCERKAAHTQCAGK